MKKLRNIVASKRWAFWTAICWSALAGTWIHRFFETRALVQKGVFSRLLADQYLMAEGILAILGVIVAVLAWRQWLLYDKKKKGFYVRQRKFEVEEMRLLAECVYAAKFITEKDAKRLVDVICDFVSEDQAKTSFEDVYEMLETHRKKLIKWFYWTKELIKCVKTGSYIKFNTANAKTKDGKRSACLIFDEEHEYETDDTLRVFRSGFGKRKHSRVFKITTNGYVRDGVLDKDLEKAAAILKGEVPLSRTIPLLYHADGEEDVQNPAMWEKACPSLPYMNTLRIQMEQDFLEMKMDKSVELDFYTKRMNLPRSNMEIAVTEWENIAATKQPLPDDMQGWSCTVGIDYASMRDWASVNFHFRRGEQRFDISKSWVCTQNPDLNRVKAPWRTWGEVTAVDEAEIPPDLIVEYIATMAQNYNIRKLALDNFRFALLKKHLETIGFDTTERKNIRLVRPSDVMKVQPVIASCFNKQLFTWGDTPSLRWATNNTKLVRSGKKEGTDTGNYYYAKIEGKSRKTDPFMALVASMVIEDEIPEPLPDSLPDLSIIT